MRIEEIILHRLDIPLITPYVTRLAALSGIETLVAEVRDSDGRRGIGDCSIVEGYTHETREGGWRRCQALAEATVGRQPGDALAAFDAWRESDPHAVSVLQVAIEMMQGDALLAAPATATRVPILGAVNTKDATALPGEVSALLEQGYRTLKVKVGWDVDADLRRLALIRRLNAGTALIRIDANQGFNRTDGMRFARALEPGDDLQLFEQPCDRDDWAANAAVAAVSTVPVMMDESIYTLRDVERAARMPGCGFVKLKISKLTGVSLLHDGLARVRELGLTPVLGNGAAADIGCLVEALVGRHVIDNAGENNGFLKNRAQLLRQPLRFEDGAIVLEPTQSTELDHAVLATLTREQRRYAATRVALPGT